MFPILRKRFPIARMAPGFTESMDRKESEERRAS